MALGPDAQIYFTEIGAANSPSSNTSNPFHVILSGAAPCHVILSGAPAGAQSKDERTPL